MESVDFLDRHLDPPDPPRYSECDGCGYDFPTENLHHIGREWLCDECAKLIADQQSAENENDRE